MSDPARLYEEDWYAWTLDQAARLRALPAQQRSNAVDIEHIAEEIEDLGREVRRRVEGLLRRIVEHLLKLEFEPLSPARHHWMHEVDVFRADLAGRFAPDESPSLYARRAELYARAWEGGRDLFLKEAAREGPREQVTLSKLMPDGPGHFDLDAEVLNPDWYPTRPA